MTKNEPTGQDRLKSFVERIEALEEEKADLVIDIQAVYAEAKGEGFDAKIIRKVIQRRKKPQETREQDELLDLYESAIDGLARLARRDVRQLDIEEHIASNVQKLQPAGPA